MTLFTAHAYCGNDLLPVGSAAPLFSLASSNGDTVKLLDFRQKKNVVLVFYPGDRTPVARSNCVLYAMIIPGLTKKTR